MAKSSRPDRKRKDNRSREPKEFDEHVLQIARVTRVVKGGRRMRFRAAVVIGNRKGRVGFGLGKSGEVQGAIQKAVADAKKNMIRVPLVKGTITHDIDHKFKAARIRLIPASEGTGIIAGGSLRPIMDLAGVKNILAKRYGTANVLVNAQATMEALSMIRAPKDYKEDVKKDVVTDELKNAQEDLDARGGENVKEVSVS
ncbi:30S ribosomal protein S5 [Candidatus Peribacteria bacterium]|jgi:small subunit ribosomal protein S5|nr:30S ribosomal protein S5 [Candidatus Peribacteria bacterium]MBT4021372.1 30S ribosomal protein S5 [Candidatus Peribacteria bacterium]MBT4240544.1 30S ribosomal protein S5 [Candidatus Peribacteria bacterium]MBT4474404.1 30S ribosomal protein S5 [Candidatus Peribacteria bacterium]